MKERDESSKPGVAQKSALLPSAFLRQRRPGNYSDTEDRVAYVLDASMLDHHLETITARNQMHDFEIFCRKLCERVICPNLRPQTGPEGGGDSKVDSETYPVSDEISILYIGEANAGRERWAFAFSAKAKWIEKVRKDVEGIIATGRHYDRIICVTSRSAKSRDRARIESELHAKHAVYVTIHDRSWIIKEVIEADRKDLAFNYLNVGQTRDDPLRLGPKDYSRARQLAHSEGAIEELALAPGMGLQLATEALVSARLSRALERPRTETDGRFVRAVRLADTHGTPRQQLEVRYEQIRTGFWWFDDFDDLLGSYGAFEERALKSDDARDLELLCNVHQLLINCVVPRHRSREVCKLDERRFRLVRALEAQATNAQRPSNALEARTSLVVLRLMYSVLEPERSELGSLWAEFGTLLDQAEGLGEFNADRLVSMIEEVGDIPGPIQAICV